MSWLQVVVWVIALLVLIINGYLLVEFCSAYIAASTAVMLILVILATLYIMFIIYLIIQSKCGNRLAKIEEMELDDANQIEQKNQETIGS